MACTHTPIIIGVGDCINRSLSVSDAHEPLTLILSAIDTALKDTDLPSPKRAQLQSSIDSIDVVRTWTWPYDDLPGDISRRLGVDARHKFYSDHGGNKPAKLFDEAARRISKGQTKVAIVTGGEALASLSACVAAKKMPPPGWTKTKESVHSVFSATTRDRGKNLGATYNIGAPIQIYPLFENGFRAHRGQSIAENHDESAQLYADFAKVAERNPLAWSYGKPPKTKDEIATVTERNRMICFPYPLLMNAFNTINLAGACILTSTEYAEELGVPKAKWIYALGGAGTQDSDHFWDRPNYHSSPAIERSLDAGLRVCGLTKDDIDLFDFYSCFPIVPKLAAAHLGLPITNSKKTLTLLGGLTSFGGAGNNYSMHAITEMTRHLRAGKGRHGLILANGGWMTYEHVLCLSTMRRRTGDGLSYPPDPPLPEYVTDVPVPAVDGKVAREQEAMIETYTVDYDRHNSPQLGHIVARLRSTSTSVNNKASSIHAYTANTNTNNRLSTSEKTVESFQGPRILANHADAATLARLASWTDEKVGLVGIVRFDEQTGRNLFSLPTEQPSDSPSASVKLLPQRLRQGYGQGSKL
ncbi:hypothetical protein ABEF92_004348 [Exophiala dermatitidis]|uniref:Acetyl-CoA C-acetyltransferase n=1 Tax=Exophiala dermatitidis (strain ATCC 34100 / CBS 525.76 / NIH/UT8656) TaxID=858893 RepID=H6C1Z9_EXODN|nr:acetyl-CoA C-acetyltransferase [Exophiala dermatitidis NIH/UT8656]EHY57825.1 acetyl-CoA C-acetyltransferase [Exophiala dermatitidis NIH/UT8656]